MSKASIEYRLRNKTVNVDGCWVWTGLKTRDGYGRTTVKGSDTTVHRAVYEHMRGPVPDGLQLDHLCRNRACCNPDHLEPVTQAENTRRGRSSNRLGKCRRGHEVPGGGRCKTCRNQRQREWYERKRRRLELDRTITCDAQFLENIRHRVETTCALRRSR